MGKARRNQRPKKATTGEDVYDESLSKADVPSTEELSSQYYNDAVDDYHEKKFKSLMEKGVKFDSDEEQYDSEDEVMPINIPEEEEDDDEEEEDGDDHASMGSDLEDRERDGLPDELAWGQKKKLYYDTDYKQKKKVKKTNEELEAEAEEEEEEAQNVQRRLAKTLNEEDYGLDFLQEFGEKPGEEKPSEEKIVKDLEKMSEKEKRKLLKKESPELLELIQDLKLKLEEVKNELEPLLQLVKDGTIPQGKGSAYLQTKYQLYMNYCTNISYYLILKAKRLPITGHPVIERLVTYRNLINNLAAVDQRLSPEIRLLLSEDVPKKPATLKRQDGRAKAAKKASAKRPLEESEYSDLDEEEALNYYKMVESKLLEKRKRGKGEVAEEVQEEEMDPNAKRAITYQISKNKGLTPKRKKIDRNPRVKHREKFRRAKIRRKGQVREVRKEEVRYSGEISGIRAGVKKSIKLK